MYKCGKGHKQKEKGWCSICYHRFGRCISVQKINDDDKKKSTNK